MRRFRILVTLIILTMVRQSDVPRQSCGLSFQESGSMENRKKPGKACDPSNRELPGAQIPRIRPAFAQMSRENRRNERREIAKPDYQISNHESIRKVAPYQMPTNLKGLSEIPCAVPDTGTSNLTIQEIRPGNRETEIVLLDTNESPPAGKSCVHFEIAGNDRLLPVDLLIHGIDSGGHTRHYYLDWDKQHPNEFGLYTEDRIREGTIHILYRQESVAKFDLKPTRGKEMIVLEIEKRLKVRESLYSYSITDR